MYILSVIIYTYISIRNYKINYLVIYVFFIFFFSEIYCVTYNIQLIFFSIAMILHYRIKYIFYNKQFLLAPVKIKLNMSKNKTNLLKSYHGYKHTNYFIISVIPSKINFHKFSIKNTEFDTHFLHILHNFIELRSGYSAPGAH